MLAAHARHDGAVDARAAGAEQHDGGHQQRRVRAVLGGGKQPGQLDAGLLDMLPQVGAQADDSAQDQRQDHRGQVHQQHDGGEADTHGADAKDQVQLFLEHRGNAAAALGADQPAQGDGQGVDDDSNGHGVFSLLLADDPGGHILGALGVDGLALGGNGNAAAGDGHVLLALDGVVPGGDIQRAARDVDVALARVLFVIGFDGVLARGQSEGAAADGHGVVALEGILGGGDGDDAAQDAQVVLGADAVIVLAVDDQFARAVDGQVVPGADAGIGGLFKGTAVHRAVGEAVDAAGSQGEGHLIGGDHIEGRGILAGQGQSAQHQLHLVLLAHLHHDLAVLAGAGEHVDAGLGDIGRGAVHGDAAAVHQHATVAEGDDHRLRPAVALVKIGKNVGIVRRQGRNSRQQADGKQDRHKLFHGSISFA